MLRRNRTILIFLVALAALTLAGCYHTPEQRAEYMVKHMTSELGLNDAQKARLESIKDEFLARRAGMAKLREETVKEANVLMRSSEIDKARLSALVDKTQTQANDAIRFFTEKFTEIHDMLTPEQREKLVKHMEEYMEHGHHR